MGTIGMSPSRWNPQCLMRLETVMDFHVLEGHLRAIIEPWQNQHLNVISPFDQAVNPSAERVAEQIGKALAQTIPSPAKLVSVRITEAPGCAAIWRTDGC